MTFREYLAYRKPTNDRLGDFVRLALREDAMPDISSSQELLSFVRASRTLAEWTEEAALAWIAYKVLVNRTETRRELLGANAAKKYTR